jgi:acyl carrier protein
MIKREEIIEKIKRFVCAELLNNPGYKLQDNEPLFSNGAIDSFAMAQIGVFIEMEFSIYIPDPELTVENMDTVTQIADKVIQSLDQGK